MGDWFNQVRGRFPGRLKRDEYIVEVCPYCGNPRRNFQINVTEMVVHCWACGTGGTVRGFLRDFDLSTEGVPDTPRGRREALPTEQQEVSLPVEAEDVLTSGDPTARWARQYLLNRGLSEGEIVQYGVKFAGRGEFAGRVIVPLFEDGELVYFVARAFMRGVGSPYMYPPYRRRNLTPVFEGEQRRPDLVLVEGFFEVPALHRLGYSVMPLLGKALTPAQIRKLGQRRFQRYLVFLDHDSVDTAISIAERLQEEGMETRYTYTSGQDSDELEGHELEEALSRACSPGVLGRVKARLGRL